MIKTTVTMISLVLLALFSSGISVELVLPDGATLEGWSVSGDFMLFEGQALYRHINGGAELYHQNGFVALAVKDFIKDSAEVRVEIYDMGSAEGAKGIFAANTKGVEISDAIGSGCSLDDYQIIFLEGQYYVSLTNYNGSEEEVAAMKLLAEEITTKINQ